MAEVNDNASVLSTKFSQGGVAVRLRCGAISKFKLSRRLRRRLSRVQCESKNPTLSFSDIFANGLEFLVHILDAYYTFISTLDYKFLFNYLQL